MKRTKRKGSSTILVILIVLTVVLFGVMNMMSVYTSYKISKKNLQWTSDYYELDSKAQIFANNIKNQIDKSKKGSNINVNLLLNEIERNIGNDRQIFINKKNITVPLDKNINIVKNNTIILETYYLDEDGKRRFYTNISIPVVKGDKSFDVLSWKRVNEEFEYKTTVFSDVEVDPVDARN